MRFHQQATEVLTQFIANQQGSNTMRASVQCEGRPNVNLVDTAVRYEREEAPAALKVAMKAVGHPQFAANRLNYSTDKCLPERQSVDHGPLWLEHMKLEVWTCRAAIFPAPKCLNRTSTGRHLQEPTFGGRTCGVQLADWGTLGFPSETIWKRIIFQTEGRRSTGMATLPLLDHGFSLGEIERRQFRRRQSGRS